MQMVRKQMVFYCEKWLIPRLGLLESQKTERRQFRKTPKNPSGLENILHQPGRQDNICERRFLTKMVIDNALGKAGEDSPFSRAAIINRPSQNKFSAPGSLGARVEIVFPIIQLCHEREF